MTIQRFQKSITNGSASLILAGMLGVTWLASAATDTKKPAPPAPKAAAPKAAPAKTGAPAAGAHTGATGGAHTGATTTGAHTTTTTTNPSTAAFQAPTPAVTPLQPWDPRSCTASGGPGR